MDVMFKSLVLGAAVVGAIVAVAVEWWQYRNVPQPYSTTGQRRRD